MCSDPAGCHTGVVIEFVGTPGSGKTTLATALAEHLAASGLPATTMTDAGRQRASRTVVGAWSRWLPPGPQRAVLWRRYLVGGWARAVALVWSCPRLVHHVVTTQRTRPAPWRLRAHVLRWWFTHAGRRAFLAAMARPGDVVVVDDGFVHRAATLHAGPDQPPDAARVAAYIDLVPRPDLTIVVTADHRTCADRIRVRGPWRHRPLDAARLSAHLVHADEAIVQAVTRARSNGWHVLPVDNDGGDLHAVVVALARDVVAWLAASPAPATSAVAV